MTIESNTALRLLIKCLRVNFGVRCLTVSLLFVSILAPSATAQNDPEYVEGLVVVQLASGVQIQGLAKKTGLREFDRVAAQHEVHMIERVYPFLDHVQPTPETRHNLMGLRRTYYVRYHANTIPQKMASNLAAVHGVIYAEPVTIARKQVLNKWQRVHPDDPEYQRQTEMLHLHLPEAWDVVKSSEGTPRVVIGIVDAGGEWYHEDLLANVWTNPGEIPNNGLDDDNNGYIDDVHGINPGNGDDTNNDPAALPADLDESDHGTAVAGAASAVTDNGIGIAGAAWNAELMHINADGGETGLDHRYQGILYAAANGADIINTSWGDVSPRNSRFINQTLNLATDMGALIVGAAGNESYNHDLYTIYPAGHPRVLAVGATEKDTRKIASFSNYGDLVDVFAPGVSILTTFPDNNYGDASGTSFASPIVAGIAALVKTNFPEMTPDALREQLRISSESITPENPSFPEHVGSGFVNALASVQAPVLPAIRVKRWNWTDGGGDGVIAPGDVVTITATIVNHLADANQLRVEIVEGEPYSFIDLTDPAVTIGTLGSGDSTEVNFEFRVTTDAPANQDIRLYMQTHEGTHQDRTDVLWLEINHSLEVIHQSLGALYTATGGNQWTNNTNWDLTSLPSQEELEKWFGLNWMNGWLVALDLGNNNLSGTLPPEIGSIPKLLDLGLYSNSLSGPIPPELSQLSQLRNLILSSNSFSGSIPPEIGNLSQLQSLDLFGNALSGSVPPEIGNLSQLQSLALFGNAFSGSIPPEIGNLSRLEFLDLGSNSFSGPVPPEIGNLSQLQHLNLGENMLTGALPRNLMQLNNLESFIFDNQPLCAPRDDEFQAWLESIEYVTGPTCTGLQFAGVVENQVFTAGQAVTNFTLPEAYGGLLPYTYTLEPTLPTGLAFDSIARTINGTPTETTVSPIRYIYKAIDAGMSVDSLIFNISVVAPVATEQEAVPRTFALHSNYPNPFRETTHLVLDLPWPAQVSVEVMDVTGRRMFQVPSMSLAAGWKKRITLNGTSLSPGLYLYQMIISSPGSKTMHVGSLVRVR